MGKKKKIPNLLRTIKSDKMVFYFQPVHFVFTIYFHSDLVSWVWIVCEIAFPIRNATLDE